jgi:hypothetical protein
VRSGGFRRPHGLHAKSPRRAGEEAQQMILIGLSWQSVPPRGCSSSLSCCGSRVTIRAGRTRPASFDCLLLVSPRKSATRKLDVAPIDKKIAPPSPLSGWTGRLVGKYGLKLPLSRPYSRCWCGRGCWRGCRCRRWCWRGCWCCRCCCSSCWCCCGCRCCSW